MIQAQKFRDPCPENSFIPSVRAYLYVYLYMCVCMVLLVVVRRVVMVLTLNFFGNRLRARIALVNVQYLIPKNWGFSPGAAHSESFDRDLHRSNQIKKGKGIRESFARNFHKIFLIILIKIQCTNAFSCYCIQILAFIYTL